MRQKDPTNSSLGCKVRPSLKKEVQEIAQCVKCLLHKSDPKFSPQTPHNGGREPSDSIVLWPEKMLIACVPPHIYIHMYFHYKTGSGLELII